MRGSQEPKITPWLQWSQTVRPLTSSGGVPTIRSRCSEGTFHFFGRFFRDHGAC